MAKFKEGYSDYIHFEPYLMMGIFFNTTMFSETSFKITS